MLLVPIKHIEIIEIFLNKYPSNICFKFQAPQNWIFDNSTSLPDEEGLTSRSIWLRFKVEAATIHGNLINIECRSALPGVPMEPQTASKTVIIRNHEEVEKQRYWSHHDYNSAQGVDNGKRYIVLLLLVLGVRWAIFM